MDGYEGGEGERERGGEGKGKKGEVTWESERGRGERGEGERKILILSSSYRLGRLQCDQGLWVELNVHGRDKHHREQGTAYIIVSR